MAQPPHDVTQLLDDLSAGKEHAFDDLMPLVYRELRRQAAGYLRRERQNHTLQPTALVNEAFLKLVQQRNVRWQNRAHFFGVAAQAMRRILVDHARTQRREKRGGDAAKVTLDDAVIGAQSRSIDLLALDQALERLGQLDERQVRVVELRFFGGLSVEETAEVIGISTATVKREWSMARAWLHSQLGTQGPAPSTERRA
jgi:RNA polymerase sigma factor (TIGR02999 family)